MDIKSLIKKGPTNRPPKIMLIGAQFRASDNRFINPVKSFSEQRQNLQADEISLKLHIGV